MECLDSLAFVDFSSVARRLTALYGYDMLELVKIGFDRFDYRISEVKKKMLALKTLRRED